MGEDKRTLEKLEDILKEKIKSYDNHSKALENEWNEISTLKPKNMDSLEFQRLLQKARYETKQVNLDHEMINDFEHNNPIAVKEWIHKGANKFKLYEYAESRSGGNLSMNQAWLLEDLHNIRKEKHFPYTCDREISDPRIITKEKFNELYIKYEKSKELHQDFFKSDEEDRFLLQEGNKYIVIDNSTGELWTEEFKDRNNAIRFLQGESIDKIRNEECKYEILVYETKEDWEQGEPFQLDIVSDLEEAKSILNKAVENNNFYSGIVEDILEGKELYAVYEDSEDELE